MISNSQNATMLLVEDDPGHARLIEKNLRRAQVMNKLVLLQDGHQAINYLFGVNHPQLDPGSWSLVLVLLDLNLPGLDGFQVLERLKSDPRTSHIPVIVLTTTDDPYEVQRCYDLGCNIYVVKPVEYTQFSETIQKLGRFLSVVTIP